MLRVQEDSKSFQERKVISQAKATNAHNALFLLPITQPFPVLRCRLRDTLLKVSLCVSAPLPHPPSRNSHSTVYLRQFHSKPVTLASLGYWEALMSEFVVQTTRNVLGAIHHPANPSHRHLTYVSCGTYTD